MVIRAVYESGILRPVNPLELAEGEVVDITIERVKPSDLKLRHPTEAEKEYSQRIMAAKSLVEMFAIMETAPITEYDKFDLLQELNESRRATGFRMPVTY
jgi:predicted DNA-binding antitoxin AbrB/MazE fold protein